MNVWNEVCHWFSTILLKISGGESAWYPLVREIAHFLGGAIIAGITFAITLAWKGPWMWMISGGLMLAILLWAEKDDMKNGQNRLKTLADLLAWCLGFILVFALVP